MVTRPRLLVLMILVGAVTVVVSVLLVLALGVAHASGPSESGGVCSSCSNARVFPPAKIMRTCQRRHASPSSPSCPRSGLKQPLALMKGCLRCFEGVCVFVAV